MTRFARTLKMTTLALAIGLALTGCAYVGDAPAPTIARPSVAAEPPPLVVLEEDTVYRTVDGKDLAVHACFIEDAPDPVPALVLIHGGGFVGGSPTAMYDLCDQAAHRGFAAFAIEYRLLPDYAYPSQVQDASAAVEWLRQSAQVTKYGIDPTAVGVIGSSAGAIVASYLGVAGDGALDEGSRVAAVVALSPVTDMTDSGLALGTPQPEAAALMLEYLGCNRPGTSACPVSVEASPISHVDSTDAPALMMVGESEVVPWQQPDALRAALENKGVNATLIIEPGEFHGQQLLTPENLARMFTFLGQTLG